MFVDIKKSDDGAYKCFVEERGNIVTEANEVLTVKRKFVQWIFS